MSGIVQSKVILVTAPPGYGKTFLCLLFAVGFQKSNRVFSNIDFYDKGKRFSKRIKNVKDIKRISESDTPGLIIMDEMGGNANPRKSSADKNIEIVTELTIYPRKKNCSVVACAQVDNMYDVYLRKTAYAEFELLPPRIYWEDGKQRLMFKANIYRKGQFVKFVEMDLFVLLDVGYSFNTMEKSLLSDSEEEELDEWIKKNGGSNKVYESKEELEEVLKKITI